MKLFCARYRVLNSGVAEGSGLVGCHAVLSHLVSGPQRMNFLVHLTLKYEGITFLCNFGKTQRHKVTSQKPESSQLYCRCIAQETCDPQLFELN